MALDELPLYSSSLFDYLILEEAKIVDLPL